MEADIAAKAVELGTNTDFSLFSLFFRADIIVKSVMIILILCSIYSWAVIIEKFRLFKKITKSSEEFEEKFWNSKSAETFYNSLPSKLEDPMSLVFQDAMEGLLKKKSRTNISERMSASLEAGIEKQMTKIEKGFTSIYSYFKKHKPCYSCTRNSRSFICNCTWSIGCNTSSSCLQQIQ